MGSDRLVLVIGGAGYIGSMLSSLLVARGYRVRILDALLYENGASIRGLLESPRVSFIKGDFREPRILEEGLRDVTDVVLLAALVGDPICKKYAALASSINQDGSIRLFKTLGGRNLSHFVFASTCSNYGLRGSDDLATEAAELNPQSLYAETKVAVERYVLEKQKSVDFSPTILRLATVYGLSWRMRFDLTVSEFTRMLALGRELLVYDPDTWRPYCHVADVSGAFIRVLESSKAAVHGEVFNVGSSDENYTKRMIVDLILQHLGAEAAVSYKMRGDDPRNYRVCFEKIARVLGFRPAYSVRTSIPRLIEATRAGLFEDVESRSRFFGNYTIEM